MVRPVKTADLPEILDIASQTGPGFNSLPDNVTVIEEKIHHSMESFAEKIDIQQRFYFFVMEDLQRQAIVGIAGIKAYIGAPCPVYKFKLTTLVLFSHALNQAKKYHILHWASEHEGATELAALYLKPDYRGEGCGALMSRSRFLFIAEFTNLFSELIVADLRGISDEKGISPFWEAIGKHFFDMSYERANYLKATLGSKFVTELIPHYPIYVDLLPVGAQNVIGSTHENTVGAFYILQKEGFDFRQCVDIFDAGPILEASKQDVRSIKESRKVKVIAVKPKLNHVGSDNLKLISNIRKDFHVVLGVVELQSDGNVILEESAASILNVSVNDYVRFSPFR